MTERYKTRKHLAIIITLFLLLLVGGYTAYEVQKVVSGPQIMLLSPEDGAFVSTSSIMISGTATNVSVISLDDRKIFIDEAGNFKEEMLLSPGYNIFKLDASDKFGSTIEKTVEVIYKPVL